jgi:hypothetical protein
MSPASVCLSASLLDDRDSPGGCVNPVLSGMNSCTETLTFSSEWSADGQQVVAEPGSSFRLEVPLDKASNAAAAERGDDDQWNYSVASTLGTSTVVFFFWTR